MEPKQKQKGKWEDAVIPVQIKLAAMWTSLMFCYAYGDYFALYVPGQLKTFLTGETLLTTPARLFAAAVLLAVPALMIFLTIALRSAYSRLLNIIMGIVYTIVMLLAGFNSLTAWWGFYIFFAIVEISLSLLIIRYSWKWPRTR